MTVSEMMRRMSRSEFEEWGVVYEKLDPFGELRADLRAGMQTAPLLNIQLAPNAKRARASDWLLNFDPPEPQDPEQMKMLCKAIAEAAKLQREQREKKMTTRKKKAVIQDKKGVRHGRELR